MRTDHCDFVRRFWKDVGDTHFFGHSKILCNILMFTPLISKQADWDKKQEDPDSGAWSAVKPLFDKADSYSRKTKENYSALYAPVVSEAFCLSLEANSQSEIFMAAGKLCLSSLPLLTFSHAPWQSPNIHTQTRPHINATLEAGRRGDSLLGCCLVTAQLCSLSQAAALISHIAILVSTHTAVGWR